MTVIDKGLESMLPTNTASTLDPEQTRKARAVIAARAARAHWTAQETRQILAALGLDGARPRAKKPPRVLRRITWREGSTVRTVLHLECGHTVIRSADKVAKSAYCPECGDGR